MTAALPGGVTVRLIGALISRNATLFFEIGGRALLQFDVGPLSWVAGQLAVTNAKKLDNMDTSH